MYLKKAWQTNCNNTRGLGHWKERIGENFWTFQHWLRSKDTALLVAGRKKHSQGWVGGQAQSKTSFILIISFLALVLIASLAPSKQTLSRTSLSLIQGPTATGSDFVEKLGWYQHSGFIVVVTCQAALCSCSNSKLWYICICSSCQLPHMELWRLHMWKALVWKDTAALWELYSDFIWMSTEVTNLFTSKLWDLWAMRTDCKDCYCRNWGQGALIKAVSDIWDVPLRVKRTQLSETVSGR